ncbi:ABC transporter ATP-binding protein [Streptomyces radicis]|uniref:ATP-binding cassette domain-containing protein n=1 Tax=Streptomyces radicis TaxID=1750517 RepID=A0A3A9WAC4_9ACTN|nr:ATP-binding cassette domain-containing protein [Streptomyces radicis]RKN10241.1 ATP-binding cassette domain-containing protein [Streptomyces radicis]RKN24582.1 ATP-binding cassette domain-containing protein [Streptomyces radicis]
MIVLDGLTKRYGEKAAVADLTLEIEPGRVTGFLGPNGAGKSTTMRLITGLDAPTSGSALIGGRPYAALRHPLREVGALLEARSAHPGRTARSHLLGIARSDGIPARRVDAVLELVGLTSVARKRVGSFSLGMRQRLGIAAALLGDPGVLLLDEPVNGLDPDGVRWIRELIRSLAAEGRTVLLSSHLMSEMQDTADHLVVIGRGRLIADAPIGEVLGGSSRNAVLVRSPKASELRERLTHAGMTVESPGEGEILVTGGSLDDIGELAFRHGVPLYELSARRATLEQAYMELTAASVEYGEREAK